MKTLRFARQCGLGEMLVLLALLATPARADQEGDFIFDKNGATAVVTRYVGPGGAVVIPDRLGNLPVASIGGTPFYGRRDLTSVTIPNSVTNIGSEAFYSARLKAIEVDSLNLAYSSVEGVLFNKTQSVLIEYPAGKAGPYTIPNNVTSIAGAAFYGCAGLTSVTIPNSMTSIGGSAFSGCTALTSITIPQSVTNIGPAAFYVCMGLKAIEVDSLNLAYRSAAGVLFNQVQSELIAYPAGKDGPYTIPGSVTFIGYGAFSDCTGLTSVTIPNSARDIGRYAFYGCAGLTSVTIPNGVTSIGKSAFFGCTGLTSINLPTSLIALDHDVFSRCTGLTSVTIPNGVTDIGDAAFSGCTGLTSVTMPNSVSNIWDGAFSGCTGLTSVTIPSSVTAIKYETFSGCSGLASISIPDSVTYIENEAFSGCTGLTNVTIPNSVSLIGGGRSLAAQV